MGTKSNNRTVRKKTSSLLFGADSNPEQIKEAIKVSPYLLKLELAGCTNLDDDTMTEIIPYINEDLMIFIAEDLDVSDHFVAKFAEKCHKLQYIKFINCKRLSEECMKPIGNVCKDLKTVAFVYKDGHGDWSKDTDALSVMVKYCSSSDLKAITFVNFESILDIGVNYAAECYFETLQKINFNGCCNLTDQSVVGLSTYCKYLRDVSMNGTKLSDGGIQLLAERCPRLYRIDLGNCQNVTDFGVQILADKCDRLEEVCLEHCSSVGDDALQALTTHCSSLQLINFSSTALTTIPASVLSVRRLKDFKFNNCQHLINPPVEVTEKGLERVLEYHREYNISYRLQIFFLGNEGCGKTSLIESLINGASQTVPETTEGVRSTLWQPLLKPENEHILDRPLKLEEKQLVLELWDLSGRWICQGIHQIFLNSDSLFIVVINVNDQKSCSSVTSYIKAVQLRAPGSTIIVVATHGDTLPPGTDTRSKSKDILAGATSEEEQGVRNIQSEVTVLKNLEKDLKVYQKIEQYELLLNLRPILSNQVHFVSSTRGEGLKELLRDIVSKALNSNTISYLGRSLLPAVISVYECLVALKNQGTVILPWHRFKEIAMRYLTKDVLESEIDFLHAAGVIIDYKLVELRESSEEPARFICIDPLCMANMACLIHVDNPRKSFKIEARRFWPRDSGFKKPDPSVLVKALEDIPSSGLIREALFPLLWQEYHIGEEQTKMVLDLFERIGLVCRYRPADNHGSEGLAMPNYQTLSTHTRFYAPLMDLLPDNRPQLNWSPKPFKGDIQIGWRYEFPNGAARGMMQRMTAVCKRLKSNSTSYSYFWKNGVLFKIGDAMLCIEHAERHVDICCRTNADDPTQEKSSVEFIWAHISVFILTIEHFLISWGGLFDKVSLVPLGNALFGGNAVVGELSFSLMEVLEHVKRRENVLFTDDNIDRELDVGLFIPFNVSDFVDVVSWIRYILSIRETIFSLIDLDSGLDDEIQPEDLEGGNRVLSRNSSRTNGTKLAQEKKARKSQEIKWNLSDEEESDQEPNSKAQLEHYRKISTKLPPDPQENSDFLRVDENKNAENQNGSAKNTDQTQSNISQKGENFDRTKFRSLEEELRVANRVASGFVAMVLAGAVAEHIKAQYEDNHQLTEKPTSAQVKMATMTAHVAAATQTGDMDGAAKAVITAAKGVQAALEQQEENFKSVQSKMCIIL